MRMWFLIRSASHAIVLWLALSFTPLAILLGGYSWRDTYAFVWPQVFLAAIALSLDVPVLLKQTVPGGMFWWSLVLEPLLAMGWGFPLLFGLWPGGDDGGGLRWGILLGTVCAVGATVSAIAALRALKIDTNIRAVGACRVPWETRAILTFGVSAAAGVLDLCSGQFWFSLLLNWFSELL